MGLKKSNYDIKSLGLTISNAYAQVVSISVDLNGEVNAMFEIQQSRDDISVKKSLERKIFSCKIDKDLPIHEQVYTQAKASIFADWEDDIVE